MSGRTVVIEDRIAGRDAVIEFTLAPAAVVEIEGNRAIVRAAGLQAVFQGEGTAAWRCVPGEYAPRFGTVLPAMRLAASLAGPACRTVIRIGA